MLDLVSRNSHRPQVLLNVLNHLITEPCKLPVLCHHLCVKFFLNFFLDKVSAIRSTFSHQSSFPPDVPPPCLVVFEQFKPMSLSELSEIVQKVRPSYCPLDSPPSRLLKSTFNTIGHYIVEVINASLTSGYVPPAFKHAAVQPLIKKHNLNPSVLSNYRPFSKRPFPSKVLERVVYNQLQSYLELNNISEKFQSGFKAHHSTETTLLRIFNDLFLTVDAGNSAALMLLDLTAAFDTVDHQILLSHLKHYVGFRGTVINWFSSYMSQRTFSIHLGTYSSGVALLGCGVPQGSILGPVLFSLYMLPLVSIFHKHKIFISLFCR